MSYTLNMRAFEIAAGRLGLIEKEVPFALANAMTRAAYRTKDALARETWPKGVNVKSSGFMRATLDVEPALARDFRAGRGMRAEIFDQLGHVDLKALALGGVKQPRKGAQIAIPSKRVQRTSDGKVRRDQKPRNAKRIVRKGNLLFQAVGAGKKSKLKLMYALRPSARIKPQVDFYGDFDRLYRAELYQAFPQAVRKVIRQNRISGRT